MAASDPNLYEFELFFKSLYDAKTPVSRSKIQTITDLAVKAQKYYKHVVMHIETFIRKSSPKHKLPGLYVIDSIVRYSMKHGKDRDVFIRRFAKNLATTFTNAAKCADEDKFKVFRCFKLWKDGEFFDDSTMAPIMKSIQQVESFEETKAKNQTGSPSPTKETVKEKTVSSSPKSKDKPKDTNEPGKRSPGQASQEKVSFDKRLLDFDYSDEEEERSAKRSRKKDDKATQEEEDFFTLKNGKPEFSVDKIMMGLRRQRGPSETPPNIEPSPGASQQTHTSASQTPEMVATTPKQETRLRQEVENQAPAAPSANQPTHIVLKSCTIWIGHLPKTISESELKRELSRHGVIKSFDVIPSRGCAYISYEKRTQAHAARSSRDLWKLYGDKVKISWSPGKGIKDGYKDWDWDSYSGICRIPVGLIPLAAKALVEGSELDEESVPDFLKARFSDKEEKLPEKTEDKSAPTEAIPAPTVPQLPVISLPVAPIASGWQTSAAFGFDPKINPWTAHNNGAAASLAVNPLLRPPSLPVLSSASSIPTITPTASLPTNITNIQNLLSTPFNNLPTFPPAGNTRLPPPAQNGQPIPTLSSISSLVSAVPSAIQPSPLNGSGSLPTSWSDPAPQKFNLPPLPEPGGPQEAAKPPAQSPANMDMLAQFYNSLKNGFPPRNLPPPRLPTDLNMAARMVGIAGNRMISPVRPNGLPPGFPGFNQPEDPEGPPPNPPRFTPPFRGERPRFPHGGRFDRPPRFDLRGGDQRPFLNRFDAHRPPVHRGFFPRSG